MDRQHWVKKSNPASPKVLDDLFSLIREATGDDRLALKYNKHYIGLEVDGAAMNFVTFMPRKAHVIMTIRLPQTKETDDQLEDAALDTLTYETQWRQYRLRLESQLDAKQHELLLRLIRQARESRGKSA